MQNHRHTVRNIDPDLILEARMLALQTGQRLGDVINEALELYLEDVEPGEGSHTFEEVA